MKTYEAFDQTISNFKITNVWLCEQTGISESSISRFRRGKQGLLTDDLDNLLEELDESQQQFYYSLLMGEISDGAIASMLYALSIKLRPSHEARTYPTDKVPV